MFVLMTVDTYVDQLVGADSYVAQGILRVILAFVAGAVIGIEREMRGREAGFRTNALVCMGAALAMVVSYSMASMHYRVNPAAIIQVDPGRIAYGIMTGVGFLGAGAILQVGASVRGLTTAAGLWCVAALGLAFGSGLYLTGAVATVLIVLALWFMHNVEKLVPQLYFRRVVIRCSRSGDCVDQLTKLFADNGVQVKEVAITQNVPGGKLDVSMRVAYRGRPAADAMERKLLDNLDLDLIALGN